MTRINPPTSFAIRKSHIAVSLLVLFGLALGMAGQQAHAADGTQTGRETGLPLPRFVSLKARSVNLRVGPGRKYAIAWHYKRRGLPVEIIQEFDQWRRIRDSEGTTGWVLHSLLSSRRTALVAPWGIKRNGAVTKAAFIEGKGDASDRANTIAKLQAGLLVDVGECQSGWCSVEAQNLQFWLQQEKLWGVYPGEGLDG